MIKLLSSLKKILLFSIPFAIIFIAYLIIDPFMVLYSHDDYNNDPYVHKNLDYITTEKYLKNSKEIAYDSYIFGGSTALYISPTTLKKYLNSSNNIYSFIASGEHIFGMWSKIKYIHLNKQPLKNAILVLDTEGTFDPFINDIPMSMKHYKVYPSSRFDFQYRYFLNFVNLRFLIPYTHYRVTNQYHPYMEGTLLNFRYHYDPLSNEYFNTDILNILQTDSLRYYEEREYFFRSRTGNFTQYDAKISAEYMNALNEIKDIFTEHCTNYRILISPAYNQKSLNREDLSKIQKIFGEEYVFDFSGVNSFSGKKSNFYDKVHFKKYVGNELLEVLYSEN